MSDTKNKLLQELVEEKYLPVEVHPDIHSLLLSNIATELVSIRKALEGIDSSLARRDPATGLRCNG